MKKLLTAVAGIGCIAGGSIAQAQMLEPEFEPYYSLNDLGTVTDLPINYGGLTINPAFPNTLIIGGAANRPDGALYAVPLTRDAEGHITGLGAASVFIEAAYNDGGVVYGPGGVLFLSRWPVNQLGQVRPGSAVTDKIIDWAPFGVEGSNASLNFVPAGFPGAGRMKIASWAYGEWSDVVIAPDGTGLYDVVTVAVVPGSRLPGGPEGFAFVPPGSPLVTAPTIVVAEYSNGRVCFFEIDANGDPIVSSERVFVSGLTGAEGAFIDPVTGDFLFSTFGGANHVIVVRGFETPVGSCCLSRCNCVELSEVDCIGQGGTFTGVGTTCADALECAPVCPCDWNGVDGLDSQDFFDFLSDFFDAVADFNCDGERDSQDYFDFNECFFGGVCG